VTRRRKLPASWIERSSTTPCCCSATARGRHRAERHERPGPFGVYVLETEARGRGCWSGPAAAIRIRPVKRRSRITALHQDGRPRGLSSGRALDGGGERLRFTRWNVRPVRPADIDLLIPHQANIASSTATAKQRRHAHGQRSTSTSTASETVRCSISRSPSTKR